MTRDLLTRDQRGLGHLRLVQPQTIADTADIRPCSNPYHCDFWRRLASGPWTCENCHPGEQS